MKDLAEILIGSTVATLAPFVTVFNVELGVIPMSINPAVLDFIVNCMEAIVFAALGAATAWTVKFVLNKKFKNKNGPE